MSQLIVDRHLRIRLKVRLRVRVVVTLRIIIIKLWQWLELREALSSFVSFLDFVTFESSHFIFRQIKVLLVLQAELTVPIGVGLDIIQEQACRHGQVVPYRILFALRIVSLYRVREQTIDMVIFALTELTLFFEVIDDSTDCAMSVANEHVFNRVDGIQDKCFRFVTWSSKVISLGYILHATEVLLFDALQELWCRWIRVSLDAL